MGQVLRGAGGNRLTTEEGVNSAPYTRTRYIQSQMMHVCVTC